jgi:hypothetical protein
MVQTTNRKLPRSLLVLVTTWCSLLIAGCAALAPTQSLSRRPPTVHVGRCTGATCTVDVNVNYCVVSVNPSTIVVSANNNNVKWTIQATDGTDYRFEEDGITTNDPNIAEGHVIDNGKAFIVTDRHKTPGFIEYTVTVVRYSDKSACPPLDPYIYNQ